MGPDPENKVGDQESGSPGRPVSSRLQVPGEPGIIVQEQDSLGELPAAFFLQNVLQLHHYHLPTTLSIPSYDIGK